MRDVGYLLVEIHGQHDERALVDADAHRTLLDAFAGLSEDVVALAGLHGAWKEAERNLKRQREKVVKYINEVRKQPRDCAQFASPKPQAL